MSEPHPQTFPSIDDLAWSVRALKTPIESLVDPFRRAVCHLETTLAELTLSPARWLLSPT